MNVSEREKERESTRMRKRVGDGIRESTRD